MNRDELEASLDNAAEQFDRFHRELVAQRLEIRALCARLDKLETLLHPYEERRTK